MAEFIRIGMLTPSSNTSLEPVTAAILHGTVARAGGHSDVAIMVGDAITDIAVARAAGIAVIAVDFGYSEIPVAELAPDRIVSSFDRLPGAVFTLLATQKDEFSQKVNR